MATLTHSTPSFTLTRGKAWLRRYNQFVAENEFYRVAWAATALLVQGCLLTPALLMTVFYRGGGDWQLLVGNLCFLAILVPILSAMPVRYILPTFLFSLLVHLILILTNLL